MSVFDNPGQRFISDAAREAHAVKAACWRILHLADPDDFVRENMEVIDKRMFELVKSLEKFYAKHYSS